MSDTPKATLEPTFEFQKYLEQFIDLHVLIDPKDVPDNVEGVPFDIKSIRSFRTFIKRFMEKEHPDTFEEFQRDLNLGPYDTVKHYPIALWTRLFFQDSAINPNPWGYFSAQIGKDHPVPFNIVQEFVDFGEPLRDIIVDGLQNGVQVTPSVSSVSSSNIIPPITGPIEKAIDSLLSQSNTPSISNIIDKANETENVRATLVAEMQERDTLSAKELKELQAVLEGITSERDTALSTLGNMALAPTVTELSIEASGEIPEGKLVFKKASDIFPDIELLHDFDKIPFWEWDGVHPDVPKVDENYIFRPDLLSKVLYALVTNQRMYLQGHTGSGKTTLVEQVAAALNYPFLRINFDSEITRMDLIGRDVLKDSESHFVDGMLPKAMSGAYITCFDEIDFVRPDIAYVMQAALEGNGLRITEDGDRLVQPDPMFRMFGTGNTVGQGDEEGMYQGARPQSLAFLDRFTVWATVEYLSPNQREKLIERIVPALKEEDRKKIVQYTNEHLELFTSAKVLQPISPRGMLAVAKAACIFPLEEALRMTVLDRASSDDKSALGGIIDRVV